MESKFYEPGPASPRTDEDWRPRLVYIKSRMHMYVQDRENWSSDCFLLNSIQSAQGLAYFPFWSHALSVKLQKGVNSVDY